MSMAAEIDEPPPLVIRTRRVLEMDDDQFFHFCAANRDLRVERDKHGDIIIMAPAVGSAGIGEVKLLQQFANWAEREGAGEAFGSNTGFTLPNSAVRAPDVAWVRKARLEALTEKEWNQFLPLCPDFVLELRSPSDSIRVLREKMEEYREQGARLGWLLDPRARRVLVYRPGEPVETLEDPAMVSGEPVLAGFELDVRAVWQAMERPRRK